MGSFDFVREKLDSFVFIEFFFVFCWTEEMQEKYKGQCLCVVAKH